MSGFILGMLLVLGVDPGKVDRGAYECPSDDRDDGPCLP